MHWMKIADISPSQLHISQKKLDDVKAWLGSVEDLALHPLPIRRFGERIVLTDGHTRAVAALLKGAEEVPVEWDTDDLDLELYSRCISWCGCNSCG